MRRINLEPIPNQEFNIFVDQIRYDITLKECRGVMVAKIVRDNVNLIDGVRCLAGIPLLPYEYMEEGNFIFTTENENLPDYRLFGITQRFYYITQDEIEDLRD